MKTLNYDQYGDSSVLKIREIPIPIPKKNEVLIKINSVAINPLDWKIRNGMLKMITGNKFPKNIGCEFSGIVEKMGEEMKENLIGKKVFGFVDNPMKNGVLSEYICTTLNCIQEVPSSLSLEEASAASICGLAALQSLKTIAQAQSGQTILIHGCTGGVGLFAIQIANKLGLNIYGVCSTKGVDISKEYGCHVVIDYNKENILNIKQKFDIILDLSSKLSYANAKNMMNLSSIYIDPNATPQVMLKSFFINLISSKKCKVLLTKFSKEFLNELTTYLSNGLKVKIFKTYTFENSIIAYKETEQNGSIGKTVIKLL
ncbi:NAD(P)-dependent alcohol dehydrogenase [Silvanigrella sp.]|jgi:NADPH:quinone reductase-like Zn-dependent oxidoreductase|uniref:NAD(P)-dependent alcohol dehydrogenase n=1 Tax=Silvanigrella sp. TaxID=2024976 RepID=UPI0037C99B23|nr:NAD(P)-dependent alcohol dehydrogenase [Silvanigrellaceae bacterium]